MFNKIHSTFFKPFVLLIPVSTILIACGPQTENTVIEAPPEVEVLEVKREIVSMPFFASGTLGTSKEMKLGFKTGGIIQTVMAQEGTSVRKGQLLASLDMSEINAKLQQAKLGLEKAKRELKRAENLYADSVATLELLQNARTAEEFAQTQYDIAKFNKKHSIITAPSHGKILKKLAEENEVIGQGYPVFLFASTENDWLVRLAVADKKRSAIKLGDSVSVSLDVFPDSSLSAWVSEIGNMADPYTGTFEVEARLSHASNLKDLSPGLMASAHIFPHSSKKYVVIPVEAILEANGDIAWVYKVEDNIATRVAVKILTIQEDKVIVKSGLIEDDKVIVKGAGFVKSGEMVSY